VIRVVCAPTEAPAKAGYDDVEVAFPDEETSGG
jgi:hypothetical protein